MEVVVCGYFVDYIIIIFIILVYIAYQGQTKRFDQVLRYVQYLIQWSLTEFCLWFSQQ